MDKAQVEALSFEEALSKLEELVEQIDTGELPLAEALETFTLATELTRHCERLLKQAETAIEQIDAEQMKAAEAAENSFGGTDADPLDGADDQPAAEAVSGALFAIGDSENPFDTDEPNS